MNTRRVEEIANAVLYEGYVLYPYRASAIKNRKRFNFGVVYPWGGGGTQLGASPQVMQTECLVLGGALTEIEVKVRFLHIVARVAGELASPLPALPSGTVPDFHAVDALEVQGRVHRTWQEAVEREVTPPALRLAEIAARPLRQTFEFPAAQSFEPLKDETGQVTAVLARRQEPIEGLVEVAAELAGKIDARTGSPLAADGDLYRARVRISNLTPGGTDDSDEALARSLVSTHTLLGVEGGEFISLLDPSELFNGAASACRNVGTFPVLAGEEGFRDTMLSSPIILYDYPQVAPESAGQFFDGTEIDEMLALRIMTLTDDEKREMGQLDEKARELLERTEALPPEHMMKLHGALRGLQSATEERP